ncbi:MAG: DUF362 domain-containing protein [Syntrophomonadaceae bacterium]|nr:DUF362 domain-containing protein [Syntrophomonadaceae bacterium]MDH7497643.1 DUF362 domain-containing protein [Syntrophomonadaceae bacterium]
MRATSSDATPRALSPGGSVSRVFAVTGTQGNDGGLKVLAGLMGRHGVALYRAVSPRGVECDPAGIVGADDVVLLKVNSQWDRRGGTNTDLLRELIALLLAHPEGFRGELVVADNGQAQFGYAGRGGGFDLVRNNARDRGQSVQKVVDEFAARHRVSTFLWDRITNRQVKEFESGDGEDGYVIDGPPSPVTGLLPSYPKFVTAFGTCLSFKRGVWDPARGAYDRDRLKVFNVPVLKAHHMAGVTGAVKHYMGVVSDKLTRRLGFRAHDTVVRGGMGTQMARTRVPDLNLLDAIWINPHPGRGPWTDYDEARAACIVAASTDAVALDYWAARHILVPAARGLGYRDVSRLDPDDVRPGSFGYWLRAAASELRGAGWPANLGEDGVEAWVVALEGAG